MNVDDLQTEVHPTIFLIQTNHYSLFRFSFTNEYLYTIIYYERANDTRLDWGIFTIIFTDYTTPFVPSVFNIGTNNIE